MLNGVGASSTITSSDSTAAIELVGSEGVATPTKITFRLQRKRRWPFALSGRAIFGHALLVQRGKRLDDLLPG
jgi:hypothetical protein